MIRLLRFVLNHPLCRDHRIASISRVIRWQVGSRILQGDAVVPFTHRTRLIVRRGQMGATGNIYCGLHDFQDMGFLLHLLRPEDIFCDVGANVGSYTILASGHVGARSLSFEPVPATFERLRDNVRLNHLDSIAQIRNIGIGCEPGVLRFTSNSDAINHVVADEDHEGQTAVEVQVDTLDNATASLSPTLIKVDVEGFEANVIAGGQQTFRATSLKAVVMELNGSGARYGFNDDEIHQAMLDFGFATYSYEPFSRKLASLADARNSGGNTLYIRDVSFILDRVRTAEKVHLPWRSF